MAIYVDGTEFRKLSDPIYVNGTKVTEGYFDGVKCYPDDANIPKGRYVLRLSGSVAISYGAHHMVKFGNYSWFSGYRDTKWVLATYMMSGRVRTTVVSTRPIALVREQFEVNTSDLRSYYGSGTSTGEYEGYSWSPMGRVPDFPRMVASIHYATDNTGEHSGSPSECGCSTHVSVSMYGMNTYVFNDHYPGPALSAYEPTPYTKVAWMAAQLKRYERSYHGDGPNMFGLTAEGMSGVQTPYGASTCGYKLSASIPFNGGGVAPGDAPWSIHNRKVPLAWITFDTVEFNNNPDVTSLTFATDPPTSEATDDDKEFLPYAPGPLGP